MINSLYDKFKPWSAKGSIYIVSDTHFDDADCKYMDPNWITPQEHMATLKTYLHKNDTLIHLGDVGNAEYLDELKCYKVLITGNHDVLSKVASHFDEVYNGPLFIADRILLSHEPICGMEDFVVNIHGHNHAQLDSLLLPSTHINLASNVVDYSVFNLGIAIQNGLLSKTENYHRLTIDKATERKNIINILAKVGEINAAPLEELEQGLKRFKELEERRIKMHNDKLFEYVKKKFENENGCDSCNNRHCDGSFDWMSACQKFNEYFEKVTHPEVIDDEKLKKLMEDINGCDR